MMQTIQKKSIIILSSLVLSFISIVTQAQEKKVDVDINVGKQQWWYQNPIVWAGVAVFILLLVALLRKK